MSVLESLHCHLCLDSAPPERADWLLFQGAKLVLACNPAAPRGPHGGAVPRPERHPVLQCQRGRSGGGGELLHLLRVPLPALHDDREAGTRRPWGCGSSSPGCRVCPAARSPRDQEAMCPVSFSSGSLTSVGAAKLHATVAPSASRRTGPPTRGTVGRRGAPARTRWSPSGDGPSGPVDRLEGGAGGVAASHGPRRGPRAHRTPLEQRQLGRPPGCSPLFIC